MPLVSGDGSTEQRVHTSLPRGCSLEKSFKAYNKLLTTHTPHSCHANTDTAIMFSLEALILAQKAPSSLVTTFLRWWRLRAVVVASWAFGRLRRFSPGSYLVNKHPTMFLPLGGLANILWSQVQVPLQAVHAWLQLVGKLQHHIHAALVTHLI